MIVLSGAAILAALTVHFLFFPTRGRWRYKVRRKGPTEFKVSVTDGVSHDYVGTFRSRATAKRAGETVVRGKTARTPDRQTGLTA